MATKTETKKTHAHLVTLLCEAFGKTASTAMFEVYRIGLQDLPFEAVERATMVAIRTCKFMPTVAELRELSGEMKASDRALKAWMAFQQAVVHYGAYKSVDFDDPTINATVRALGGWEHVCGMSAAEFDTFLRKNFESVYVSLYSSGVGGEQAAPLMGIVDRENGLLGYNQNPPVRVTTDLPPASAPRIGRYGDQRPSDLPRVQFQKP